MNKNLIALILIIISFSNFGQSINKNAISLSSSAGVSNSEQMNANYVSNLSLTKSGGFYSIGGEYCRRLNRFEFGLQLNVSKSQQIKYLMLDYRYRLDSISTSGSDLIIYDTIFYVGQKCTFSNSFFNIQIAPIVNFYWLQKDQYKLYTSLQLGVNNVFRDVYNANVTYEKVYENIDTSYVNGYLKYMRSLNFSSRFATGALFQLTENFYLKSELYYESKLYSIFKDSPSDNNKAWTRFYNYGVNVGLRYCF